MGEADDVDKLNVEKSEFSQFYGIDSGDINRSCTNSSRAGCSS